MFLKRKFAWFAVSLSLIMIIAACGGGNSSGGNSGGSQGGASSPSTGGGGAAAEEKIEIVFQSHVTPNLTDEFYDGVIAKFEEQYPHIKVTRIQASAMEGSNDNYLKTLLAAGDFPDIASNFTFKDFADADALWEIPIDDDIKNIKNYESHLIDGKLYVIQPFLQPHSLIFYNKKMFAEAGITSAPKTWADLVDAAEKLKQKGFTPILTSGEWVTGHSFGLMLAPEIYGKNPNWYTDRYEGKVSFTDPNWIDAATRFHELAVNGYFNEGALSIGYTQLEQEFLQGNGAMYPMGVWFTAAEAAAEKDFEVGVFPSPSLDGDLYLAGAYGMNFSISKKSKHPEAALQFIKFLVMDPENHKTFAQADGLFSGLVDPINYEFTPLQQEVAEIISKAERMTGYDGQPAGSFPAPGISNQFTIVAQNLLLKDDKVNIEEQMASLDEYWEKNAKP